MANTELQAAPERSDSWAVAAKAADPKTLAKALQILRDLFALTKPRITALVLLTEAAGIRLAPGAPSSRARLLSVAGTTLIVGSANALNMWWERDLDGRMKRTRNRPLPAGRLLPDVALAFGLMLALVGVPMLFLVNVTTGLLGLLSLVTYVAVYTPLKRSTYLALLVGAVPGAIPPLLGWTTVTGRVGAGGLLLFGFLFLWQIPHFAAISLFRTEEYRRAGLQVVSVQRGEAGARRMIALYAGLLVVSSLLFAPLRLAGSVYEIAAAVFGAAFLALAARGLAFRAGADTTPWSRLVFAFSIPYLAVLLVVLWIDHRPV